MPSAFRHKGGAGLTTGARGVANDAAGAAPAQGETMDFIYIYIAPPCPRRRSAPAHRLRARPRTDSAQ